jgi:toxin FitB
VFVLDTDVVAELRKIRSGKIDPGVGRWAEGQPSGLLFVSAVSLAELEHGVLLAERADAAAGAVLRRWLEDSVTAAFATRVLPVDEIVARRAATLQVPDPAPLRDALIGATALIHGMAVVTRNARDFARFDGLDVVNPWS